MAADARHTLGDLGVGAVVEARWGEQRMVSASARGLGLAGVDVIREGVHNYGWELLKNGAQSLRVVRWPQLLQSLSATSNGRGVLEPVSTWYHARQSLLRCATARAVAGALIRRQVGCSAVWQDLWSQCCGGGCVPSRSVLPL